MIGVAGDPVHLTGIYHYRVCAGLHCVGERGQKIFPQRDLWNQRRRAIVPAARKTIANIMLETSGHLRWRIRVVALISAHRGDAHPPGQLTPFPEGLLKPRPYALPSAV